MIQRLLVKNYVLIAHLDLELEDGFTVVTGETGAGKSIILGALRLILGERADTKALFDPQQKCIVEGAFDIEGSGLTSFFEKNDLDFEAITTLRREIIPSGKSRAFINDTPVNLALLKTFGEHLVEIHSQHNNLDLKSKAFHYVVLDAFSGLSDHEKVYQNVYTSLRSEEQKLESFREQERQASLDLDYQKFLLEELLAMAPKADEQTGLENALEVIERSEDIVKAIERTEVLVEGDRGILDLLGTIRDEFAPLAGVSDALASAHQRLASSYLEIKDLSSEISGLSAGDHDAARAAEMRDRLNALNQLQQKHRVNTVEELMGIQAELEEKVASASSLEKEIVSMEQRIEALREEGLNLANSLSEKRRELAPDLAKNIEKKLALLAMPDAKIEFALHGLDELTPHGKDDLKILFNTNAGGALQEVHKAASGGELARLMLTIKAMLAGKRKLPTVIFDEIDTGVSGEVASRMGDIMAEMGHGLQVLAITHLPQVAGKGNHHFSVYKEKRNGVAVSFIEKVEGEDRLLEIAKMLSGDQVGSAAVDAARQLMNVV